MAWDLGARVSGLGIGDDLVWIWDFMLRFGVYESIWRELEGRFRREIEGGAHDLRGEGEAPARHRLRARCGRFFLGASASAVRKMGHLLPSLSWSVVYPCRMFLTCKVVFSW